MSFTSPTTPSTPPVFFPEHRHQILSTIVHLLGCSILSACLARRFSVRNMSLAKACIVLIFVDSWLFVFSSGVVVNGVGMSLNLGACLSGIYLCIFFYASSKIVIYIFLAEKVHIVWSAGNTVSRLRSKVWLVCCFVLVGYLVVFVLMLVARIGFFREDGTCVIGLKTMATIPLLTYDIFLNIFLTGLFVWPLYMRQLSNPKLKSLATRTCFAAAAALCTSVINIAILTTLHGRQLAWVLSQVCLASCSSDVTINAAVIYAVSRRKESTSTVDMESHRNPLSYERPAKPSPAFMFKDRVRNKSNGDGFVVTSRSQTLTHICDLCADDSQMTMAGTIPDTTVSNPGYDYLPKDQVPTIIDETKPITPFGEMIDQELVKAPNLSVSYNGHQVSGEHSRRLISHGHRRSSRSLIAEFKDRVTKRSPVIVEDVAIQVTVMTEHTPTDDSALHITTKQGDNTTDPSYLK
ncbi:hypothetical protein PIIN_04418 [Serendipita indica DSM 11827]|uniref:Transmembrane protein n=1 Tax=Serendipita indica (strain DSM 11827) TaxID=1109443 RepID=G4TGP3_SERID|nr:hypothetical protein PIIN_04418 [Serendipita indica DSM 11827]